MALPSDLIFKSAVCFHKSQKITGIEKDNY